MNETTMMEATTDERTTPSTANGETANTWLEPEPVRVSVALLADAEIELMGCDDLIDIIRLANLPHVDAEMHRRLEWMNGGQLRRMAYLTRHCCRKQVNATCDQHRRPRQFKEAS